MRNVFSNGMRISGDISDENLSKVQELPNNTKSKRNGKCREDLHEFECMP